MEEYTRGMKETFKDDMEGIIQKTNFWKFFKF